MSSEGLTEFSENFTKTPTRKLSKDGSVHVTDEFYNTLISGCGAILFFFGTLLLVGLSFAGGKFWHGISFLIYGLAATNLFIASALHHGVNGSERIEYILLQLDYCAIFLMIAGTFTPFCLVALDAGLGKPLLAVIWFLAFLGIFLKVRFPFLPKWILAVLFLGMGWIGVVIAKPLYLVTPQGAVMIFVGGVFFTVGAVIYYLERPNPVPGRFGFHEIWHLFVLAGSLSHFAVMYFYILPL